VARSRRFNYEVFCASADLSDPDTKAPATLKDKSCKTVGCIAGWVVALFGGPRQIHDTQNVYRIGRTLLGLSDNDANFLFYGREGHGLDEYNMLVSHSSDNVAANRREALKRIDILLATEKTVARKPKAKTYA
jgi:hypothetical protein